MEYQTAIPSIINTGGHGDNGLMGGGLVGGLLLGSLMRNGGFGNDFGNGNRGGHWGGESCVTPTNLTAGLTGVTDAIQNTEVMAALGDIKASVPLAEAQVQLALAGSTGEIRSHIGAVENTVMLGQSGINQNINTNSLFTNKNISDAIASSLSSQSIIKETVLTTASQNLQATMQSKFDLSQAITADGERTRALITSFENANTQRLLGERQDQINELLSEGRRRDDRHGIDITMINNQSQNQMQFQQQQQMLNSMHGRLCEVDQVARATNQQLIIGNTGVTTGGAQSSNPTNVNA